MKGGDGRWDPPSVPIELLYVPAGQGTHELPETLVISKAMIGRILVFLNDAQD